MVGPEVPRDLLKVTVRIPLPLTELAPGVTEGGTAIWCVSKMYGAKTAAPRYRPLP